MVQITSNTACWAIIQYRLSQDAAKVQSTSSPHSDFTGDAEDREEDVGQPNFSNK